MSRSKPKKYTNKHVTPCAIRKSARARMRRVRRLIEERKKQIDAVKGLEMCETDEHNLQQSSTDVDIQQKPIETVHKLIPEFLDCNVSLKIEHTIKEEPLDADLVAIETYHDIKPEFEDPDELNIIQDLNLNHAVEQSAPPLVAENIVENPFEHWWSNDRLVQLIEMFRARPVLWDSQHPLYKNKDEKRKSLDDICDEIVASPFTVLKKIAVLQRYLLKELNKKKQWASQGKIFRSTWTYFERTLFLRNAEMAKAVSYAKMIRDNTKKNNNAESQIQTQSSRKFDIRRNGDAITIVDDKNNVTEIDYCDLLGAMIASKLRTFDHQKAGVLMKVIENILLNAQKGRLG